MIPPAEPRMSAHGHAGNVPADLVRWRAQDVWWRTDRDGLFTRVVAFFLAGEMAVAYFPAHFPSGFWPILNGGEAAVLYCWIFLMYAATGGGRTTD